MNALVAVQNVTKTFGATAALREVSFDLSAGEVHALVGENGAGKSTLINILAGVLQADEGQLLLRDRLCTLDTPAAALRVGIATVFQELSLVSGLSVGENVCASRTPARLGLLDRRAMRRRSDEAFEMLGVPVPSTAAVFQLSASQRQLVEIAKALDRITQWKSQSTADHGAANGAVLILDEPTSALTPEEKRALFAAIRNQRARGVGIIYISHHLDEVMALADRITVLRDGAIVWTRPADAVDGDTLVRAMVGREVQRTERQKPVIGAEAARFEHVALEGYVEDLSMSLHYGEVLAIAGLDGSGREWVARLLASVAKPDTGEIFVAGRRRRVASNLRSAMRDGIGYVPDDRKTQGLFLDLSIALNAVVTALPAASRAGFLRQRVIESAGSKVIAQHGVKANGPRQRVGSLSGGNQQKVLFGKWLQRDPRLLVVEEPSKGVDIAAKGDIHRQILAHARAGNGVLLVSSDLPEILELADRIVVLHRGRIAGVVDGEIATEEQIMTLAAGVAETGSLRSAGTGARQ